MGSPVPQGTVYGFSQDVQRGVLVSIQDEPTLGTHMRPGGECFLHTLPTARAILACILWGNGYHFNPMHHGVGLDPPEEVSPGSIVDTLSQRMVFHHIADLEVFIGNHIVR